MNNNIIKILYEAESHEDLFLENQPDNNQRIKNGYLRTSNGNKRYKIDNYILRFIASELYAKNFGYEWRFFNKTQLDSHSGTKISKNRWMDITSMKPEDLNDKVVLEAGCGSGRFLEVVAPFAKNLIGVDLSRAIEVSRDNIINEYPNVDFIQADLNHIPIKDESIDFIYSIGVLDHTPSTLGGIQALSKKLKPGGKIAIWVYGPFPKFTLSRLYRFIGSRIDPHLLLKILKVYVPFALKTHRIPLIGKIFKWVIFPAPEYPNIPIPEDDRLEWSILDAYDNFSSILVRGFRKNEVIEMLEKAGLQNITEGKVGNSFIAQKPS